MTIYLRDFAETIDGTEQERVLVNLNRQKAVKLSIQKQPDANTVSVVDAVFATAGRATNIGADSRLYGHYAHVR